MTDVESERRAQSRLLEVLIRAALIGAPAVLCYRVFSPFLTLLGWSVILAVTLYLLHQQLARRVGASLGAGLLLFLASFAGAAFMMTCGEHGTAAAAVAYTITSCS